MTRVSSGLRLEWQLAARLLKGHGNRLMNRTATTALISTGLGVTADDPCRLPNAFLADPPLDDVVAQTFEVGARGVFNRGGTQGTWQIGAFRTSNKDDILFISAGPLSNQGFFDNVGRTRREGIELSARGSSSKKTQWFINYTHMRAVFEEDLSLPSPNHPLATNGEITVSNGDKLPLLPSNVLKAGVSIEATARLTVSFSAMLTSKLHLRGDEGNQLDAIDGYTVANLRCDYAVNPKLSLFLTVDNLFDAEYETFGLLGQAGDVLGDGFTDNRFLSPGAPRGVWLGARVSL